MRALCDPLFSTPLWQEPRRCPRCGEMTLYTPGVCGACARILEKLAPTTTRKNQQELDDEACDRCTKENCEGCPVWRRYETNWCDEEREEKARARRAELWCDPSGHIIPPEDEDAIDVEEDEPSYLEDWDQ